MTDSEESIQSLDVLGEKPQEPKFKCDHYARKCKLVAPCCNKVYSCRVCHDEAQSAAPVNETHNLDRKSVEEVECCECELRQPVAAACTNCQTVFGGAYFCPICRLYDDVDKQQFHCDGCGICRIGGKENFVHCYTCSLCFRKNQRHKCIENSAKANCPVCMEDIHSSRIAAATPPCGHLLHSTCQSEMLRHGKYACPVCSKSMVDMTKSWSLINRELDETPMPLQYRHLYRNILCNDCNKTGKSKFHVVGMKCNSCGSFNTVMGEGPMVRRVPPADEHEEETFTELTEDELRALTNVNLPIPDGVELSEDEEESNDDGESVASGDEDEHGTLLWVDAVENANNDIGDHEGAVIQMEPSYLQHDEDGIELDQLRDLELD